MHPTTVPARTEQPAAPPTVLTAAVAEDLRRHLVEAAHARQQQLTALSHDEHDHVIRAQREALTHALTEIGQAQQRLVEGTFGTCGVCGQQIAVERLEVRPWSSTCVGCAGR